MARVPRPPRWLTIATAAGAASAGAGYAFQVAADRRWDQRSRSATHEAFEFTGMSHRVTSADGGTVYAVEAGDGPTVVLGHGIAGDHTHWSFVARRLVDDGCRVVMFDQRGHGRSEPGADGYSLAGLAHDVAAVIDELGGDDAVVVAGHSMGGVGVQALTRHHPEVLDRLTGIALVATLPHTIGGPLGRTLTTPTFLRAFRRLMMNSRRARIAMRSGFGERFTTAMLDQLASTWANTSDEALLGFGHELGDFSLMADLASLAVPTVVICGTRDTITPIELSEQIHAAITGSELQRVPGAGHMIVWEAPDVLAARIAALFGGAEQSAAV